MRCLVQRPVDQRRLASTTMRTSSSLLLALLPVVATASQSATIYLQPPPPAQGPRTPSLSPFEANSVLAHYTGLSRSIFSEVVEDAVDFGRKEWDYLWHSVHPVENAVGAGRPDVVMIVMQSDYPQGMSIRWPPLTYIQSTQPPNQTLCPSLPHSRYQMHQSLFTSPSS